MLNTRLQYEYDQECNSTYLKFSRLIGLRPSLSDMIE